MHEQRNYAFVDAVVSKTLFSLSAVVRGIWDNHGGNLGLQIPNGSVFVELKDLYVIREEDNGLFLSKKYFEWASSQTEAKQSKVLKKAESPAV